MTDTARVRAILDEHKGITRSFLDQAYELTLSRNLLPAALDVVDAARALDDWAFEPQSSGRPWPVRREALRAALDAWDAAVKEAT